MTDLSRQLLDIATQSNVAFKAGMEQREIELKRLRDRVYYLEINLDAARASRDRLRAQLVKLRVDIWGDCDTCHENSGYVTIHTHGNEGIPESDADDQPCPDCNPEGDSRDAP